MAIFCVISCQEMLGVMTAFKENAHTGAHHPSQSIIEHLASDNSDINEMNSEGLQSWYQEYVKKRAAMGVTLNFKTVQQTES